MKKQFWFLSIVCLFALVGPPAPVQAQDNTHKVYSVFIYNFTKYVQWSEASSTDFVIGVMGNTPLLNELQDMTERIKVNGRKIIVKKLGKAEDAANCQLVVLGTNENDRLAELIVATKLRQVLIVSESANQAQKGASISFRQEGGRVKLEMNKTVIEAKGMKISGDLMKYANIVG